MRGLRRFLWILVALAAVSTASADIAVPPLTGRVVDLAGLLSPAEESLLTKRLADYEAKSGAQIAVATLPSLKSRSIEEWATALFRAWGLGREGEDDGVLLLVAPKEREVRIEVGYGLEGRLPDAVAADIIRAAIVPQFKQGKMSAGIQFGVEGIIGALDGRGGSMAIGATGSKASGRARDDSSFGFLIPIFLFFSALIIMLLFSGRRGRYRGAQWRFGSGDGSSFGSSSSSSSSSSGGFSGGGGSSGGGGASGRW